MRVLLAGGGTAGHVNPLLATAAALAARPGGAELTALGTADGLEHTLVPAAGYPLRTVPRVPLPRRPTPDLLRLPGRLRTAVRAAEAALAETGATVVVGFGGYVATPAYLAARRRGVPVVIHEQNARPGLANRLGARWAAAVAVTFPGTPLRAARGRTEVTGLPLRPAVAALAAARAGAAGAAPPSAVPTDDDASAAAAAATAAVVPPATDDAATDPAADLRARAARELGLDPGRPTLVVTGGSLGAQRLNTAVPPAAGDLLAAGAQVLHLTGRGKDGPVRAALAGVPGAAERYHVRDYLGRMELAYAVADLVLCRAGAGTVSELAALGLPAVYVPLPVGNGEQRRNAADVVRAGGGLLVDDAALDPAWVRGHVVPLLADPARLAAMGAAAAGAGPRDGAARLAALVADVAHAAAHGGGRG
ncbi:undecaprenyldiphospho-muramoylpentapeptide beta-N-acetylglucosaminyltransferase [Georgenia sp. TF02-10]|uniref:undecaprenyldiphospho-muramoylpentapeptide beta-N-acetylglucosaminyltransferase n=1 Tax=Georgenia sp. TF02-10 TaxID=2917725 RepID=UPI001FA77BEA|nr:undecaprenyldiphospho-muramoylpentapeptide beta-N-acetylglucosaminyltransferase [Georgenia sp. TF02-10]UNX56349.1 undecaprenyldiphospho-muramoylpentapeptide beta-N-acetylglucosaminyltransferase [Georgenia sp. TF02-10]